MNYQPLPCRGKTCKAQIYWLPLKDRLHPFNDEHGKVSHFSTCPDALDFRKPKPKTTTKQSNS